MEPLHAVQDIEKVKSVGNILLDVQKPLKQRFRALFTLRNLGGKTAIDLISKSFSDSSDLLKHECAFCLGQMQDTYAIPMLVSVLKDKEQCAMVRHEAGTVLYSLYMSKHCFHFFKHSENLKKKKQAKKPFIYSYLKHSNCKRYTGK